MKARLRRAFLFDRRRHKGTRIPWMNEDACHSRDLFAAQNPASRVARSGPSTGKKRLSQDDKPFVSNFKNNKENT
jgi:hypothetical protein